MRPFLPLLLLVASAASGATLEIVNTDGAINVTVVHRPSVRILAPSEKVRIERVGDHISVTATPPAGETLDIGVELPLGFSLEASTGSGDLSVEGMLHFARLHTNTGAVTLHIPLIGSRFQVDAEAEPGETHIDPTGKVLTSKVELAGGRKLWRYRDSQPERAPVYGNYRVSAKDPSGLTLRNWTPPEDWPLKYHWQAPEVLDQITREQRGKARVAEETADERERQDDSGVALFRSDVRMVSFVLAVGDKEGHPVVGLDKEDFRVFEDGKEQQAVFAGSDDSPYNMAILLDLSGSARLDREPMRAAAEGFIRLAGERDKVAVYALAGDMIHVVSPLTDDKEALLARIEELPRISGASPVYDAMTLAYADALHAHAGERNALIVVSDGIDNRISDQELPSSVKLKQLVKAAEHLEALVYPIFLRSGERFGRKWSQKGREAMEEIAAATGGRVFPAESVEDLAPVFPQVDAELRSVYSVAYYPDNQNFDGEWRKVKVEIARPDVVVRSRQGYYAR